MRTQKVFELLVIFAAVSSVASVAAEELDTGGFGDLDILLKAWKGGKVSLDVGDGEAPRRQLPPQEPAAAPQQPSGAPVQQPIAVQPPVQQPKPIQPSAPAVDDGPVVPRKTTGTLTCSSRIGYVPPPQGKPAAPLTLKNGDFVADGKVINLHGVNWFGFNAHATYLHGLWVGQASANSDFAAIIHQFKLLGFNAVRLPFLFGDLATPSDPIGGYCTHQSTLEELAQRTVDPEFRGTITKQAPQPAVPLPDVSVAGSCNTYIPPFPGAPKLLAIERYAWTVQWLIANGFYVMIDYHPMGMEQTTAVAADFVREWKKVWSYIACLPNFEKDIKGRLLVDICNEPDSQWQGWQPKNGKAGFTELYLGAMDAIEDMTPGWPIFVVEGAGQGSYAGLNWGNGFVTDPAIIKEFGITDANPFFRALLTRSYLDRMVISPHLYGPSVSGRKDWYKGKDWMLSLDKAFGYLGQAPGFCHEGKCHVFPVAVGEFGSRFTNPEDLAHLEDLALYMNAQGMGNTGGHRAFNNWFYWAYNANSGDTGGLVDDSWMKWEWVKLRYLHKLGLRPWYE